MNKLLTSRMLAIALGGGLLLSAPFTTNATQLSPFKTVFDTDMTSAGIGGMRDGTGSATLALTGVGSVTEAWLYWHGPSNVTTGIDSAIQNVQFNGNNITGDFLGASDNNCWGFSNSVAYRADVSSFVTGDGNYGLANFIQPNANINGVSLIVFHDDGDNSNNRDVVMFDGNDSNINNIYDPPGWDITLAGINYASGSANMQMHVSDGQTFPDDAVTVNSTIIAPAGSVFDGTNAQDAGSNSPGNGLLWDIRDFDVTSLLSPGSNTLNLTSGQSSDCLSCVLIAVDLPAGAAPDQPGDVPEPTSIALISLGLLGVGYTRRRLTA